MKQTGGMPQSLDSGELLYITSGFLTLQFELQNFLSTYGLMHTSPIASRIFQNNVKNIPQPSVMAAELTSAIMTAQSSEALLGNLLNISHHVCYFVYIYNCSLI